MPCDAGTLKEFKQKFKDEFSYDWDPETFDWKRFSFKLATSFYQYFDCWWNSSKYNWLDSSWALIKYCKDLLPKWWNPERFNWRDSGGLAKYCSLYFDIWWNAECFWYDEMTVYLLFKYCRQHKHKWYKDAISRLGLK